MPYVCGPNRGLRFRSQIAIDSVHLPFRPIHNEVLKCGRRIAARGRRKGFGIGYRSYRVGHWEGVRRNGLYRIRHGAWSFAGLSSAKADKDRRYRYDQSNVQQPQAIHTHARLTSRAQSLVSHAFESGICPELSILLVRRTRNYRFGARGCAKS